MEAHAAGARRPVGRGAVLAQGGELAPGLATVGRTEEGRVFGARVDGVRVCEGRLEVPDSLELKGARGSVIPLMRAGLAVVRTLDHLTEPARVLRRVESVRISR